MGFKMQWQSRFLWMFLLGITPFVAPAQNGTDSTRQVHTEASLQQQKEQQQIDSIIGAALQKQLDQTAAGSDERRKLEDSLAGLARKDAARKAAQKAALDSLRQKAVAHPVTLEGDTLFQLYTRIGSFTVAERAEAVSRRLQRLYDDPFFSPDSLRLVPNQNSFDLVYRGDNIIMTVTEFDGLWFEKDPQTLAGDYLAVIRKEVAEIRAENSLLNILKRAGYVVLILLGVGLIIHGINRFFRFISGKLATRQERYFKGLQFKSLALFTPDQHYGAFLRILGVLRVLVILIALYLALPLLFGLFPKTKPIADTLLHWILSPVRSVVHGILAFLPNLFTIAIIVIATHYLLKGIKYFTNAIAEGNLQISGFYPDWALPTFNIVRFLVYAFMVVIIFPYLPGSQSPAFQGVSVFLGILLSLGSSSAIANIVAGLVITYMRPFRIGDRVKIGDVAGDVIEKTLLVTRIRNAQNEDITVPNATILSSHTVNYSTHAATDGLILHTTVTIGYDVPWKQVHEALIAAALRTTDVLAEPEPFVFQTGLEDFYVAYELNAYTRKANGLGGIYSELHQHIQDCCNEAGIEIMSPHYGALRDGSASTIPEGYQPPGYEPPPFNVKVKKGPESSPGTGTQKM